MVLIVGATGKIGKLLLKVFGDQAVGTTRRRNSKSLVFLDVESKDCDQATLSSKKFDYVFYCIGELPTSKRSLNDFHAVNAEGISFVKSLLTNQTTMVYFSTVAVYGFINPLSPIDVGAPLNPMNHYALSKLGGENKVQKCFEKYVIFRLPPVYMDYSDPVLKKRVIKNKWIEVIVDNDSITHSFCSASRILETVENLEQIESGIYHLTDNEPLSVKEIKKINKENSYIRIPVSSRFYKKLLYDYKIASYLPSKLAQICYKLFLSNTYL